MGVSIVVPAYNEERRLPATLQRLCAELPGLVGEDWEVVVADDGSTDGTRAVAAAFGGRVRVVGEGVNRGKGAALRLGAEAAGYDVVVFLDADLPVGTDEVVALARDAARGDLVVGSRRLPGATLDPPQPAVRRLGGWGFLTVVRLLGYDATSDPQCGVKALRSSSVLDVVAATTSDGFGFDVELIEGCRRRGLAVADRPVHWRHVPGSTLRPVRDALRTLGELARLRTVRAEKAVAVP